MSLVGFKQIVNYIYPIIGIIGIVVIIRLAFSYRSFLKPSFNSGNYEVHTPGKQAEDERCRHNKV